MSKLKLIVPLSILGVMLLGIILISEKLYDHNYPTEKQIIMLKQKYSAETINYFYGSAFSEDSKGALDHASKWRDDIHIYAEGNMWPDDSLYLAEAIVQLNELNLPIRVFRVNDISLANLHMLFGDTVYFTNKLQLPDSSEFDFAGRGMLQGTENGRIEFATIMIRNDQGLYSKHTTRGDSTYLRKSIILEELFQSLGLSGDNWNDYDDFLFNGHNNVYSLTELNKESIKLLYEKSIPFKYSREQFDKDFSDVLYHKDAPKKIAAYIKDNKLPSGYIDSISINSHNNILYKSPRKIFVRTYGEISEEEKGFIRKVTELVNTVNDNLYLEYTTEDDLFNQYPCINITYKKDNVGYSVAERWYTIGEIMFPYRVDGRILQTYGKEVNIEIRNLSIASAICRIIGLDNLHEDPIDIDSNGNPYFKPGYREILALLYEPIFWNGMPVSELDEAIRILREEK